LRNRMSGKPADGRRSRQLAVTGGRRRWRELGATGNR
jgi:hypothetical protein